MDLYSVVIPVYNSTFQLETLYQQIDQFFEDQNLAYELIFINDGSANPDTFKTIQKLAIQSSNITAINLRKNYGQHAATLCGLAHCRGNYVITMDDDLQHDPKDIGKLISLKDHDIVLAKFQHKKHNMRQLLLGKVKNKLDEILMSKPRKLQLSSFRLMKKEVADSLLCINTPYPYFPSLMFLVSNDIVNATIQHQNRHEGKSGYTCKSILKLAFNLLFNNSTLLLRTMTFIGFATALICFGVMAFFIFKKLIYNIEVTGWTSLFVLVSGTGGLILATLGIIGEYLVRLLAGIEKRPAYFIKEIIKHDQ
jgi:glycosyltransferase involved in cell wall biosynthesis